jgi:hypothetical protein
MWVGGWLPIVVMNMAASHIKSEGTHAPSFRETRKSEASMQGSAVSPTAIPASAAKRNWLGPIPACAARPRANSARASRRWPP